MMSLGFILGSKVEAEPLQNKGIVQENDHVTAGSIAKITVGSFHACLVSQGAAYCWGDNRFGQVGDGTLANRNARVLVQGLDNGVIDISAGAYHTCAVVNGAARCWGLNNFGQLGDGTTLSRSLPITVTGLESGVYAINAGHEHTCALVQGFGIQCWGRNDAGQLGDGTAGNIRTAPVNVVGLGSGLTQIEAGWSFTCALSTEGAVKCWGINQFGQLGTGNRVWSNIPVAVLGLDKAVTDISAGSWHGCAALIDGMVKCWGLNDHGQLGDGTTIDRSIPTNVKGLGGIANVVSAGEKHTCAVIHEQTKCWGWNNFGQIGDGGKFDDRVSAADVALKGNSFVDVSTGERSTCAIMATNEVTCWGANQAGQVGDGTTELRSKPVYTLAPTKVFVFVLVPEVCIPIQQKC
jgi:alpha-tubulin suppressor-like RCC1 family protein